ncbi:MAG: YlmC/YmxH family sporulation protein [Lachnospiraceae bacterium]|nr:YlmC/YmxH family sporulation protein [Lachnospiraceae bacterium]
MLFSELKCKEVVNLRDCRRMGHVTDFEFDECTGCIIKIIVPGVNRWKSLFNCDTDYVICYPDIKQIGPDIILVDVP